MVIAKEQKSGSGDFSYMYRLSSTKFLFPELNFGYINLDKISLLLIPSLGQPCRPELKVTVKSHQILIFVLLLTTFLPHS